ncbi:hypothetical protein D3C78_1227720 [compost metagenome]
MSSFIYDIGSRIANWPADGNRILIISFNLVGCREGRILCRPIAINNRNALRVLSDTANMSRRQDIPAHYQLLYPGEHIGSFLGQLIEQRSGQPHKRNAVLLDVAR